MFKLLRKLWKVGLLKPRGLWRLWAASRQEGVNLMAVLNYASRQYGQRTALHCGEVAISFADLHRTSRHLAVGLAESHGLQPGQTGILCRNHIACTQAIAACARLGVHVLLLNVEMAAPQLQAILAQQRLSLLIHDPEREADVVGYAPCLSVNGTASMQELLAAPALDSKLPKCKAGRIVLLTGGTSGRAKTAGRKPSIAQLLYPAMAMLLDVEVDRFRSVYVATPLYHGYGLSAFMIAAFLGLEMHFLPRFSAKDACELIARHRVEGATLVPLMLQRMLRHDAQAIHSLKCILSGGAPLSQELAAEARANLGEVLFNLYGTSESGFSILAKPADLVAHPGTIGRPIRGVRVKLAPRDEADVAAGNVGILHLRTHIAMESKDPWLSTGDVCRKDADGLLYLLGRGDQMIVSGGENVFPADVEAVLLRHPDVQEAAVLAVEDAEFGHRLWAFLVLRTGVEPSQEVIRQWLSTHLARYQMPAQIHFIDALPMLETGKVSRVRLMEMVV
ncbi:MAG: AMP-binding protein [Bacteroidia bacterium]